MKTKYTNMDQMFEVCYYINGDVDIPVKPFYAAITTALNFLKRRERKLLMFKILEYEGLFSGNILNRSYFKYYIVKSEDMIRDFSTGKNDIVNLKILIYCDFQFDLVHFVLFNRRHNYQSFCRQDF